MRVYGPVPSRRFGLSLGIDVVPHKTCPLDCIYCQLGPTEHTTCSVHSYYPLEEVVADVRAALAEGPEPDVITLAGSGEPTLYADLEPLIRELKKLSSAPVLLITNAVMLPHPQVRSAALAADVFAPSLDAGNPEDFARINRPAPGIDFDAVVRALRETTWEHPGEIRLEIMLVRGINDSDEKLRELKAIVDTLRCDRIDLNTPVRPPVPERGAMPCDQETLERAQRIFGPKAHAIASFARRPPSGGAFSDQDKTIRETLLRRPCTRDDLCNSLGLSADAVRDSLERLVTAGVVAATRRETGVFYEVVSKHPSVIHGQRSSTGN